MISCRPYLNGLQQVILQFSATKPGPRGRHPQYGTIKKSTLNVSQTATE